MPSTFSGLVIFIAFLIPGFVHYAERQRQVPPARMSALIETATLSAVSLLTNVAALGLFGLLRLVWSGHTPEPRRVLEEGGNYVSPRLTYLGPWVFAIFGTSCLLAYAVAARLGPLGWAIEKLPFLRSPLIIQASAWYREFEAVPDGSHVFLGCDLRDGSFVSGYLDWYSTEVDETSDRDLALAKPLTRVQNGESTALDASRLIVSARDIRQLHIWYVDAAPE